MKLIHSMDKPSSSGPRTAVLTANLVGADPGADRAGHLPEPRVARVVRVHRVHHSASWTGTVSNGQLTSPTPLPGPRPSRAASSS